ncbi:hypothetical protein PR003_g10549 [Phytophthora rubi]|uniref:Uncharacterized protein n=1 Tax=Phytophthora rubi TaxID=129364 RepID=A0A6A4FEY6_9STRA|nr:hypothetical protein PR002_g11677 [Phytophthora rubi]KAE9033367.1 hypothetical protein PR001_g10209 [Phytophthora rubi]KAE9340307.1 hypothetical protein PR003_g10549 [Phytophthora rubi]
MRGAFGSVSILLTDGSADPSLNGCAAVQQTQPFRLGSAEPSVQRHHTVNIGIIVNL